VSDWQEERRRRDRVRRDEVMRAYGIVRFSPGLEPGWHYPGYSEAGPWGPIDDFPAVFPGRGG
jgi:hypothetical protein